MNGRPNLGSVPFAIHDDECGGDVTVHLDGGYAVHMGLTGAPGAPAIHIRVPLEPVAARALAALLVVAAETVERSSIESVRTIAIARSRR